MRDLIPRRFAVLGAFLALIFGTILVAPAAYAAPIVSVEIECGTVSFTNNHDVMVYVRYTFIDESDEVIFDGYWELAANRVTPPVPTSGVRLDISAGFSDEEEASQVESFPLPQGCDETDETDNGDTDTDDVPAGTSEEKAHPVAAPASGL